MKIFYSWQSDLQNSECRGFIQGCIDKVVKNYNGTLFIEADRDTKNETGTPDITATIFDKIADCDLFIADISIINKQKYSVFHRKQRPTPNPNVLLELGYASCVLGWERIICIYNTDYSDIESLPFDLRQRRITTYSLKGRNKSEVRYSIVSAISATIDGLMLKGEIERIKGSNSAHKLLCHNADSVFPALIPNEIGFDSIREKLISKGIALVKLLNSSSITFSGNDSPTDMANEILGFTTETVKVDSDEQREVTEYTNRLLNENLSEAAFCFGNLKYPETPLQAYVFYKGSDEEKQKFEDYTTLKRVLSEIHFLDIFKRPFEGVVMLPLAIRNISKRLDTNINLTITAEGDDFEIIAPSQKLIDSELGKNSGFICEFGYIRELFEPKETLEIKHDSVASSDEDITAYYNDYPHTNHWDSYSSYDDSDFEESLSDCIASPNYGNVFEFKINALQANETKWLPRVILLKIKSGKVTLRYSIKSDNTDGTVSGVIETE